MQIIKIDAKMQSSIKSEKANGLSAHFERMRSGSMPTPRTPLFKSLSADAVQRNWQKVLDTNRDKYPDLVEYETSRWAKFGPQGGFPPLKERMDSLELYFSRISDAKIRSSSDYLSLLADTRKRLFGNTHSLRALTPAQVLKRDTEEDKLDSNAGLPDFRSRTDLQVQTRAVMDANSGAWKTYPCILGSRSARKKARFIFMFPMSTNLIEKGYEVPIMDAIRANDTLAFKAWEGFDAVEDAFHEQGAFMKPTKVSMDYVGMDQTMGPDQMAIVYDLLAPIFQPQYRDGLKESLEWVNNIPIMIGEDELVIGKHGIASGSGWTNMAESLLSAVVHELIRREYPLFGDQLLGDDGAMTLEKVDGFANVIADVSAQFGLEANPEKQRIDSKTLIYLQRFFQDSILIEGTDKVAGSYPTVLAINSAMNPEKFHSPAKWNSRMESLRWIMILENCKHNPMFHELIDFFIKGDRDRLGLNYPGWLKREIVTDFKTAKTIKGFVPTYTDAYRKRNILDFEVVKYLRTKQ